MQRKGVKTDNWRALQGAAEKAIDQGEFSLASQLGERAVRAADAATETSEARPGKDASARASARRVFALALLYSDRSDDALRVARDAQRIARAARARTEEALAEITLGQVIRAKGDYLTSLRHAHRAAELARKTGEPAVLGLALAEHGLMLARVGDADRARALLDEAVHLPAEGLLPLHAFKVLSNVSTAHRMAGRYVDALSVIDRAEALARQSGLKAALRSVASSRALIHADIGAFDIAWKLLDEQPPDETTPAWQRAKILSLRATIAQAAGDRPEVVDRLAREGLGVEKIELTTRLALEQLRAQALFARGRAEEAERVAVGLAGAAAKSGHHAAAALAMALAARAGHADAWLLRWLGAIGLAKGGVSARVEHAGCAALANEPDPIGALARTLLSVVRERLVACTPTPLRATMRRTLRQTEARLAALRKAGHAELETALDDDVLRGKDEVGLVGSSTALLRSIATLARAARSEASVVITGETGSGKELFARLAHRLSARCRGPFVAINCAAIPQALLEAELFGHERGAFTGAERARSGLFVEAEGGTLLLDELGEMSAAMQAKLLRVLEDRTVRPVGGSRSRRVDVRVVAATHRDLAAMVASGAFREDLFYRLAAITVRVPSLRERPEDLPTVARALLTRDLATKNHRLDVPALTALAEHTWPGNVRELANALRVAAAMTEGVVIGGPELSEAIGPTLTRTPQAAHAQGPQETTLSGLRARHRAELRALVGRAIAGADGNKRQAARALGVSRQGLYRVLGAQ